MPIVLDEVCVRTHFTFIKLDVCGKARTKKKESVETMFYCDYGVNRDFFFFVVEFAIFLTFHAMLFFLFSHPHVSHLLHVICVNVWSFCCYCCYCVVYTTTQIILLCPKTCEIDTGCNATRRQWRSRWKATKSISKYSSKTEKEI